MNPNNNSIVLLDEMDWLQKVIDQVIGNYFKQEAQENHWTNIPLPEKHSDNIYHKTLIEWNLNIYERLFLALILAPQIKPEILDIFFTKNTNTDRRFTEFGGVTNNIYNGFLPTAQTFSFLIATVNPELTFEVFNILSSNHVFSRKQILKQENKDFNTTLNTILFLNERWLHYFITGKFPRLEYSVSFPALPISTNLNWEDLVIKNDQLEQVKEINSWINHQATLRNDWGLKNKIKPGFRALFYGPEGTGKTLTTTLIGKSTNKEVYRVDLSMILLEYLDQTEKNISKLFDLAENNNWILFFDEADSLFNKGKATSNDRNTILNINYLWHKIEDFSGTVILATNLEENLEDTYTKKFQSIIHFAMPNADERLKLWKNTFSNCLMDPNIDFNSIANQLELTGAAIVNVFRNCALALINTNEKIVTSQILFKNIKRELKKETIH